ncbi:hypothetical protein STBA_08190 [Streptomyces sp. MP131-18]|nr:hypothetical protein STBA_08190 [Streptomyces sp. MP131-18]
MGGAGGQRPQHRARGRCPPRLAGGGPGILQDDVGVGAADTEGGHAGAARAAVLGPGQRLGEQGERAGRPVDVRGRLVRVQRPRQHPLAHGHHHLDHAADPGGGLGVPDIRLQRAEVQRLVAVPAASVGGQQRRGFDGVTECGAGAVRLHRVDIGGAEPGRVQGLPDDLFLRSAVGGGEPVACPVLVDRRAAQHGKDPAALAARVAQPLEHQHTDALRPAGAVGAGGERLAASVGGQPALAAELQEHPGIRHHGDAAGQSHGAFALAQCLGREVEGDQ